MLARNLVLGFEYNFASLRGLFVTTTVELSRESRGVWTRTLWLSILLN